MPSRAIPWPEPEKVTITRLDDPDKFLIAQFNPQSFEEVIQANYRKVRVIGLPHSPLQYLGTSNHSFRFELVFSDESATSYVLESRNFLYSLLYPVQASHGPVTEDAPPRVLFVWPQVVSMNCVITRARGIHNLFYPQGMSRLIRVELELEEVRDVRLLSEEVALSGTQRAGLQD